MARRAVFDTPELLQLIVEAAAEPPPRGGLDLWQLAALARVSGGFREAVLAADAAADAAARRLDHYTRTCAAAFLACPAHELAGAEAVARSGRRWTAVRGADVADELRRRGGMRARAQRARARAPPPYATPRPGWLLDATGARHGPRWAPRR